MLGRKKFVEFLEEKNFNINETWGEFFRGLGGGTGGLLRGLRKGFGTTDGDKAHEMLKSDMDIAFDNYIKNLAKINIGTPNELATFKKLLKYNKEAILRASYNAKFVRKRDLEGFKII